MEILLTVLITLMVVALTVAVINLVRLNKKAQEHDLLQMEVMDVQNRLDRMIENLEADLRRSDEDMQKDYVDRIEGWVASTDRRFDKAYNEIHKLNETVNPNSDLLKK